MAKAIMDYIPKTKIEAVSDAYKDEDGYWICLNEGWEASRTDSGCRTIHEDTIKDLRYQIAGIQRVTTEDPEPETVYDPAEMARPDEYQAIHDSMVESFYEFCTGEKIPENWKEIVKEERAAKAAKPAEAVEIVLEDITEDPEYFDTPIPPKHDPEPQPPAPKSGSGRGAAETVAFSLCMGLAYAVYGAKELAVILFYAIQAGLITLLTASRISLEAALRWWTRIYPHVKQNGRKTAVCAVRMAKEAVVMMAIIAFMIKVTR